MSLGTFFLPLMTSTSHSKKGTFFYCQFIASVSIASLDFYSEYFKSSLILEFEKHRGNFFVIKK